MRRFRWVVMLMLFLASLINYLDRSALAYTIIPLEKTFHLNNCQFGLLASAFGLSYVVMSIVGGILVDKIGPRKVLSLASLFWSITSACIALTTGFFSIFICRLLLGMAEGPAFPALTKVAGQWLPAQERAKALALSLAAVPFSSVIGAPLVTYLMLHFGWRTMFVILGTTGIFWTITWYTIFRNTPKESNLITSKERKYIESHLANIKSSSSKASIIRIITNPDLFLAYIAYFCLGYLLSFSISWLPGFMEQSFHVKASSTGWLLSLPWLLATLFILIGGSCSDWLWKKTQSIRHSRTELIASAQLLSGFCFLPLVTHRPSLEFALILIAFGLAFGLMPISALYSLNNDLAHKHAGTSQGIMSSCLGIASFLAPAITGLLTTEEGDYCMAILVIVILSISSALMLFWWHMQNPAKQS